MFKGIFIALVTPFTKSGEVNTAAIKDLIDYLLEKKVDGFYVCGGTGEGLLLSEEERRLVLETAVKHLNGRAPLIAHVGAPSTQEAARLARHASENGANAVASIPPIYYPVGSKGITAYYQSLAEAAGNPVFFYNLPSSTNFSLNAELAKELFSSGTIQGVKYTSSDMLNLRTIMDACDQKLTVFSGPDEMLLPFLTMDIAGGIGATYNCIPQVFTGIYNSWHAGDVEKARALQNRANRTIIALAAHGVIGSVKAAMGFLGIECGDPRGPLNPLDESQKKALKTALEAVDFFEGA